MVAKSDIPGGYKGLLWLLGGLFLLCGLFLTVGGIYLITLKGSWYFALMDASMLISGICFVNYKPFGAWLYAISYILAIVWSIWEVGLDFWPLISRLALLGGLGMLVAFAYPMMVNSRRRRIKYNGGYKLGGVIALLLAITVGSAFMEHSNIDAMVMPKLNKVSKEDMLTDWRQYANTSKGTRFSAADQITKNNINQLEITWTFNTGDIPENSGAGAEDQNTPLQINDTVFVCTPHNIVYAIDADTGEQKWRFDPKATAPNWERCRGLAYYEDIVEQINQTVSADEPTVPADLQTIGTDPESVAAVVQSDRVSEIQEITPVETGQTVESAIQPVNIVSCPRRLLMNTIDARLMAINADTGELCQDFGEQGIVDLKKHMGEIKPGFYEPTAAPLVAGDIVVVGGRIADNFYIDEPPGVVRAYDVHSGDLVWVWDPGNPDITNVPPEGQTYTRATVNVWATLSYDPKLNLIYAPTGNATPDFWAGERTELDDKYSSSIIALEAKTGKVRWSYQTTHHDLWDYDLPAQPLLYDIPLADGSILPALVQVTKQGEIFLINRETGQPLADVEERTVPQGNIVGERYSATQPFSVGMPSIGNETLTESDMWGATPFDQLLCRIDFMGSGYQGLFTPPGMSKTLQYPGSLGGMNWGSVSVDPTTSYMFVNDMRIGLTNWMIPRDQIKSGASGIEMGVVPQEGTPFGAMRLRFMSVLGVPCQKPPYGTMSAIDLKTRKLVWQVPVGTVMDTGIAGIPMHLPIPIGMPTLGGSMATKSGLLFFAGTQDFYLRAFDSATGKEVWKARLPVGSQGTPMTYISQKTGRQYVVLSASGTRQSPIRIIAYALPQ